MLILSKHMHLDKNMQAIDRKEIATFTWWILDIGDGIIRHPNDGYGMGEIPQELLITKYDDLSHTIVHSMFLDLCQQHNNTELLQSSAILASTNETIHQVNDYTLSLIPGNNNIA